jgi:histidine triad (HIT) family protein
MTDCIFCDIIHRADPKIILYQDEQVTAFHDLTPRAPVHILLVTNKHFESIKDVEAADEGLIGHLMIVATNLAVKQGLSTNGFRLVINTGRDAGQSVFHLHLHLLGGRPMPMTFGYGFNGELK